MLFYATVTYTNKEVIQVNAFVFQNDLKAFNSYFT